MKPFAPSERDDGPDYYGGVILSKYNGGVQGQIRLEILRDGSLKLHREVAPYGLQSDAHIPAGVYTHIAASYGFGWVRRRPRFGRCPMRSRDLSPGLAEDSSPVATLPGPERMRVAATYATGGAVRQRDDGGDAEGRRGARRQRHASAGRGHARKGTLDCAVRCAVRCFVVRGAPAVRG